MRSLVVLIIVLVSLADLAWNLTHVNIGLVDFYGLASFAAGASQAVWPATPYFPAGYPLLLVPGGMLGNVLVWGYVLSAGGLALGLWALYRLTAELKLDPAVRLLAVLLAALMPSYRIAAGSPSVDALYTGLGMWLLSAALSSWVRSEERRLPRWLVLGLVLPSLTLPLLRYHALLLVLPLLAVLLLSRPRQRRTTGLALGAFALAFCFNLVSGYVATGSFLPSASGLQLRCGVEFDYPTLYTSPEALFADYPAFAEHARSTPLFEDYSPQQLAAHTLRSWSHYLKRPAVLLALLAALACLVLKRRFSPGTRIGLVWVLGYTLALSPAYFTPRASLLPEMAAVVIGLVTAQRLYAKREQHLVLGAAVALLLAGFLKAGDTSLQDYRERSLYAELSESIDEIVRERRLSPAQVGCLDWQILPLSANPWCAPYATLTRSWTDDPLIPDALRGNFTYVEPAAAASGAAALELLILPRAGPARAHSRPDSLAWKEVTLLEGYAIYERIQPRP